MNRLDILHDALRNAIHEYQQSPFNFLYERDLQALVFAILYQGFSASRIRINGGYHPGHYGGNDYIETVPVKSEYPNDWAFDIAIIDGESVENFDPVKARERGWLNDPFWNQPVRAAIEIKYCQLGESVRRKVASVGVGVAKLLEYRDKFPGRPFLGIALAFVQSDALNAKAFCVGQPLPQQGNPPATGVFRHVVSPSQSWMTSAETG